MQQHQYEFAFHEAAFSGHYDESQYLNGPIEATNTNWVATTLAQWESLVNPPLEAELSADQVPVAVDVTDRIVGNWGEFLHG